MVEIILCDDDPFILQIAKETIHKVIYTYYLEVQIACVSTNYQEIMGFIDENPKPYLYFMDLDFGQEKLNGIDIAKLIKQKEPLSKVVFVTNHHEMALEVLKSGVEPFGFIEKNSDISKMEEDYLKYIQLAIGDISYEKSEEERTVELVLGIDEKIKLPLSHILYIEAVKTISHGIAYHTINGSTMVVRDSIEKVLENLGEEFMRTHRSVIVHKKYVVGLEEGLVRFANGETAACSFRLRGEVKKLFTR
ncbi:MAG: response regulator transcription factor [Cellulosilyticum sp.]|nr:response regulator transcription factor [Cellulosilyticum sp.]